MVCGFYKRFHKCSLCAPPMIREAFFKIFVQCACNVTIYNLYISWKIFCLFLEKFVLDIYKKKINSKESVKLIFLV